MQNLKPSPDLLNQNLPFNEIPSGVQETCWQVFKQRSDINSLHDEGKGGSRGTSQKAMEIILVRDDGDGRTGMVRNCQIQDLFLKVGPTGFPNGFNEGCESQG